MTLFTRIAGMNAHQVQMEDKGRKMEGGSLETRESKKQDMEKQHRREPKMWKNLELEKSLEQEF